MATVEIKCSLKWAFIFLLILIKISSFSLYSPTMKKTMPSFYNCNSNTTGVNPPFNWTNAPSNTKGFALLMGSYQIDGNGNFVASGYDWGLYFIPPNVSYVTANCSNPYKTSIGRAAAAWNKGHPDETTEFYYKVETILMC